MPLTIEMPEPVQSELWRVEDRLTKRMDDIAHVNDIRHTDNIARLDAIEKLIDKGMGAAAAFKYMWHAITAAIAAVVGFALHWLTTR